MINLAKAILIGAALVAGLFAIPVIIAVLVPLITFVIAVGLVWFILKIFQDEPEKPP